MQLTMFPAPWSLGLLLPHEEREEGEPKPEGYRVGILPVIGVWTTVYPSANSPMGEPLFEPVVALASGKFIRGSMLPIEIPDSRVLFLIGPGEDATKTAKQVLFQETGDEESDISIVREQELIH